MNTVLVGNLVEETKVSLPVYFSDDSNYARIVMTAQYRFERPTFHLDFNLDGLKSIVYTQEDLRFIIWHEIGHYFTFENMTFRQITDIRCGNGLWLEKVADSIAARHTSVRTAIDVLERILANRAATGAVDSSISARISSLLTIQALAANQAA